MTDAQENEKWSGKNDTYEYQLHMVEEQLREGERPGGSLGPRVLRTKTTVKVPLWKEKMDFGEKLRKILQITLKRDIIVVRTNRFWYDNGAFWYCNCCYEIVKNHLKMCEI